MLGLCRIDPGREEVTATAPLGDREFLVPNMVCEGCAEKIAETLTSIPGVRDVKPKVPQTCIRVRYEPGKAGDQQIKDALGRIGFPVLGA